MDKYKNFFYPDTIAIIGASRKPFKFGNLYLKNLLEFGFPKEKMFPINPSGEVILGIQSYPSLDKTPEKIGLAYITVPAKYVVQELRNCIKNSIDSVIIVSSGFKELDEKGVELEDEIKKISDSAPINVIGPNCFGTYCPRGNITLLPGENFPKEQGSVAIFAQSGGVTVYFIEEAESNDVLMSKAISYGNACDVGFTDLLEYLQNDPETKIISAYVEGLTTNDARNISKILSQITKPTIIYRAGLTEDGSRAAQSHTGFLAGKKEIWNGFFKQANIIKADSLDDLVDFSTILHYIPKISGNKIGIIAGGGAIGTELSDLCNRHGLRVPTLSDETQNQIQAQLNVAGMIPKNPVDLGNPMYMMTNDFARVLNFLANDKNIDLIIIDQVSNRIADNDFKALIRIIKRYQKETKKPVIITLRQTLTRIEDIDVELQARKVKKKYQDLGIPVYTNFSRAIKSISRLYLHSKRT